MNQFSKYLFNLHFLTHSYFHVVEHGLTNDIKKIPLISAPHCSHGQLGVLEGHAT